MSHFDPGHPQPIPGEPTEGFISLRGKFLLASANLLQPHFARTVVLVVRHDPAGALGVVVNRPLGVTLEQACGEQVEAARGVDAPLFHGGPCEGPLVAVHNVESLAREEAALLEATESLPGTLGDDDEQEPWAEAVTPGVWFCARREALEALMRHYLEAHPTGGASEDVAVKFIAGYAGWDAGQLEGELAEGSWQVIDASMADVYAGGGSPRFPAPAPSASLPPGALGPVVLMAQPVDGGQDPTVGLAAGIRHWIRLSTRANIGRMVPERLIPPDATVN